MARVAEITVPLKSLLTKPSIISIPSAVRMNVRYVYFEVEPEIVDHARFIASKMPKRVKEQIEAKKGEMGIRGQEIFNAILLQFKVPNLYAQPILGAEYEKAQIYRMINNKHFDFYIPELPEDMRFISVKTIPSSRWNIRFLANHESWENERHDVVVAVKIDSKGKARLCGWLYAKEVEELPICTPKMDLRCKKPCYWTYFEPWRVGQNRDKEEPFDASLKLKALRPMASLMKELMQISILPEIRVCVEMLPKTPEEFLRMEGVEIERIS